MIDPRSGFLTLGHGKELPDSALVYLEVVHVGGYENAGPDQLRVFSYVFTLHVVLHLKETGTFRSEASQ